MDVNNIDGMHLNV